MGNRVFTAKKIFFNITRNRIRSLILVVFSFLLVLSVGFYFGNLDQNRELMAALGEKIPVTATVTNSSGDRVAGLDITEKRLELFIGLGLKEYVITAESYGNIRVDSKNAVEGVSVHLAGINSVASMNAWKPEFSQTQEEIEELLLGDEGVCFLNEDYIQERGISCHVGDVININLYRALYDEFDSVSEFIEITSTKLKIAGFYQVAQENAQEAANMICPLTWLARQYQQVGKKFIYSSASGIVGQPLKLNELKAKAEEAGFQQVDIQSVGGRSGNALVIDDQLYIQSASQLENSIHLLKLFRIPLALLVIGIFVMVLSFAMCYRKKEIYLECCMGRRQIQIVTELVGENTILTMLGGVAALLITEVNAEIFILGTFFGIQIVTTIILAVWLSAKCPMEYFLRME